jgi:hypothetical protein
MFLQMFMISKSGGLIYHKNFSAAAPDLDTNEQLRLGSTFHGLHAISAQISPVVSGGIESLDTDTFRLASFQAQTGIKFIVTALPATPDMDLTLRAIYELYTDYVLKVSEW